MAWSIFSDGGGDGAALTWAQQLIQALGVPNTASNIEFIYQWEKSEGGGGKYNPLNQGNVPGAPTLTSNQGPQYGGGANDYVSWAAGLQGAVDFLHMSNYTKVLAALKAGDGNSAKTALWASPWAQSHYGYGTGWSGATPPSTASQLQGSDLSSIGAMLSPYSPTTNVTAAVSPQELAQQYGYAYSMLNAIPELKNLFNQAVAGQWDATRFQASLLNTKWYQQHSAAQRAYIAEGYTDPSTQRAQWQAKIADVNAMAAKMGARTEQGIIGELASQYLQNGWSDTQLQQALSKYIQFDTNGAMGGQAGDEEMTLRGLANNNGVSISNNWLLTMARHIGDNSTTLEDAQGYLRQQAEKLFPNYAKQIAAGQNMSDLAAPYAADYQKILEVGPGQTNLFDQNMVTALQYKDPTGQNTTMPLWQFDQSLRNDPRWAKTQNAQDTTMGVGRQILQQFGFSF